MDVPVLRDFLELLPGGRRAAFEFRHASWHDPAVFAELRARKVALCIADSEKMSTPVEATADYAYFRLRDEGYQQADIERWAGDDCGPAGRQGCLRLLQARGAGPGPRVRAAVDRRAGAAQRVTREGIRQKAEGRGRTGLCVVLASALTLFRVQDDGRQDQSELLGLVNQGVQPRDPDVSVRRRGAVSARTWLPRTSFKAMQFLFMKSGSTGHRRPPRYSPQPTPPHPPADTQVGSTRSPGESPRTGPMRCSHWQKGQSVCEILG